MRETKNPVDRAVKEATKKTDAEITLDRTGRALAEIQRARALMARGNFDQADVSMSNAEHLLVFFRDYVGIVSGNDQNDKSQPWSLRSQRRREHHR
jgi:hypothetical protein